MVARYAQVCAAMDDITSAVWFGVYCLREIMTHVEGQHHRCWRVSFGSDALSAAGTSSPATSPGSSDNGTWGKEGALPPGLLLPT